MNAEEIVKALRICSTDGDCEICPYSHAKIDKDGNLISGCDALERDAADLIESLTAQLTEAREREKALTDFAISAERDYMECDKMFLHVGRLRQNTGYNKRVLHLSNQIPFEDYMRGPQKEEGK